MSLQLTCFIVFKLQCCSIVFKINIIVYSIFCESLNNYKTILKVTNHVTGNVMSKQTTVLYRPNLDNLLE